MGVFGGEEEGGGVRSGPGEARTILLFHIISDRSSKQPLMVPTFLREFGAWFLFFVSARRNKRHHLPSLSLTMNLYPNRVRVPSSPSRNSLTSSKPATMVPSSMSSQKTSLA
jgi:hypothetical protein